jgi:hypothetical protein
LVELLLEGNPGTFLAVDVTQVANDLAVSSLASLVRDKTSFLA